MNSTTTTPTAHITGPWQPAGADDDPTARLLTTLVIDGSYYMHLTAVAVVEPFDEGPWFMQAADDAFADEFEAACLATGDAALDTIHIDDRRYVLVASPFA
jgi:hypothetical protein